VVPSNIFYVLIQGHAVTSGRRDRSSPSVSALCGHPRHCRTTPDTVATSQRCWDVRGQDIAATATVPRTGPRQRHPRTVPPRRQSTNRYTAALEAAPVRTQDAPRRLSRSGIRQDGRQLHSTVCHTSTRREIVRHACKLLPPWPIKGGAAPQPRGHGTTGNNHSLAPRLLHDIGTRLNQTSGTWRPRLLSRLACSHPSTSTTVRAIQCPEHTIAGRTAPAGTRINQVSLVA
jgi:hypothetical protein